MQQVNVLGFTAICAFSIVAATYYMWRENYSRAAFHMTQAILSAMLMMFFDK